MLLIKKYIVDTLHLTPFVTEYNINKLLYSEMVKSGTVRLASDPHTKTANLSVFH